MTIRRSLALLLAAGLAFTAAACSDDDPDEGAGSTTTEASTTTVPQTTSTISDEEFSNLVDTAAAALTAANGDFCAVLQAAAQLPAPSSAAQVERTLPVYSATYDAFAASIESEDPQGAEALRTSTAAVLSEVEEANFDPETLVRLLQEQSTQSPEFTAALRSLEEKVNAECMTPPAEGGAESPDTTPPENAPDAGE